MNAPAIVWVVDDDASIRWVLERALTGAGLQVRVFPDTAAVREALSGEIPDALVCDLRMPGEGGLELLAALAADFPTLPVIVMTAHSDLDAAVSAYEGGAFDYLPKPFDIDAAVALARRAVDHGRRERPQRVATTEPAAAIVGEAPAMQELFRAIGRLKRSIVTVLIVGETGTGKELVARALHRHSTRASRPFVTVNTAAIPTELIESELFGHERGAFTGAQSRRVGRFEQADGGTLFLDEIGDMPPAAQTRLLRVLAEGEFHRVGGADLVRVDVRVIAATHRPLEQLVADGRFRDDLYHRLNVVRLEVPPLRERPSDIPLLLSHFLDASADELKVSAKRATPETAKWLQQQPWPGNVRELANLCRWLTVLAPADLVHPEDLPAPLRPGASGQARLTAPDWQQHLAAWAEDQLDKGAIDLAARVVPAAERILMEAALKATAGQRGEAAKRLGWGRNTLARKLKE